MPRRDAHNRGFGWLPLALGALLTPAWLVPAWLAPAWAMERRPVAAVIIYPGDIIRDSMLTDIGVADGVAAAGFASDRALLVGKVARRTLLPGHPIPANAVGEPRLIQVGAMVRIVYQDEGLTIQTYASALQAGGAGDIVAVRNPESGVTISGIIQSDGSVHVGGG